MKEKIKQLRTAFDQKKGQQIEKQNQLASAQNRQEEYHRQMLITEEAQAIIQLVAKQTQDQLRYRIEEPVSLAMSAVFDNPLSLRMEFPIRRGRTECDMIWATPDGMEYNDLEFSDGGGALDVAAFGLQIAVLALMRKRARPILLLDEPLKWLKGGDLPERGAMMMSEISKELGIQIIMVSHIPEQKEGADRLIHVTQDKKGISHITTEDRQ